MATSKFEDMLKKVKKTKRDADLARAKEYLAKEFKSEYEIFSFMNQLAFRMRDELKLNPELSAREAFENVMNELEGA